MGIKSESGESLIGTGGGAVKARDFRRKQTTEDVGTMRTSTSSEYPGAGG